MLNRLMKSGQYWAFPLFALLLASIEEVQELSGDLEEWENEMDYNQEMITN